MNFIQLIQIFPYLEQKNRVYPHKQSAVIGDTVTIVCISDNPVMWSFNGRPLLKNVITKPYERKSRSYLLIIKEIDVNYEGSYECKGTRKEKFKAKSKFSFQRFTETGSVQVESKVFTMSSMKCKCHNIHKKPEYSPSLARKE